MISRIKSYFQLMKPAIMLLVLLTGSASLVLEKSLLLQQWPLGAVRFMLILLSLLLTGGAANAFNMYLERHLDAQMERTRTRRPLPLGKIIPGHALAFAIIIGIAGVAIFAIGFNIISAVLATFTIIFYSFFYTLYLKPRTSYNIVIGGLAGAMAPVIAWAAVSGAIALQPLILFIIIFLWTPPHFWSLAIHLKRDYEAVNYPMLPVIKGDAITKRQIFVYALLLVASSGICLLVGSGWFYAITAAIIGIIFIIRSFQFLRARTNDLAYRLFGYSIVYLCALFSGLIIDAIMK